MIAFGLFSVGCFLYPTISNQINEHYNESTINEYNRNVNTSSDSEIHAELQMAAQYNKVIATDFFDGGNEEYEKILNDYFDILDVDDGIMGTIEIPSIKVKFRIWTIIVKAPRTLIKLSSVLRNRRQWRSTLC